MKEEGIVIKSIPYKETSKIVYLYTNKGKISVRAIGSKNTKKNTFGFGESGNIVSFITTDSDFPSLTEYEIINSAYKYVNDFDSIMALGKIIEILNYIPEDSIHNKCYPFVKDILLNLDTNPKKALAIFLIKMTYNFGISPKLDSCVICNNKNIKGLSIKYGGALCSEHINESNDKIKIWTEYYKDKKKIEEYSDTNYDSLLKDLNEYYLIHANINLKL